MHIQSKVYTANTQRSSRSERTPGPDDVPPEFPERHTEPGPDDVYDPDFSPRRGGSDYDGPHFYEGGGGGGFGGVLF